MLFRSIAVTLGVVILREDLNWRTFAGGAMIIAGIGMLVVRKSRKREPEHAAPELMPKA